jgi:copper transport protein
LACALVTGRASAHAYVVSAQPAIEGGYQMPQGVVAVTFDEPIDVLDRDALEVDDARGRRIDRRDAHVDSDDATRLVASVPLHLAPGVYTVRWRVVSADTHVVHGAYRFGVDAPVSGSAPGDAQAFFDPSAPLPTALRWLGLIGALIATGALTFRLLVLDGLPPWELADAIARKAAIRGSAAVLVAAVPALLVQAAAAGGRFGSDLAPTLLHSMWGAAWLVRVTAAAVLLILAIRAWRRVNLPYAIVAYALLLSFSFSGHALALSGAQRALAVAADSAHFAAASIWVGGVGVMISILSRTSGRLRELFARFTPVAIACAVVVALTGAYGAFLHVPQIGDLVRTVYGETLVAKMLLFLALIALGYLHLRAGRGRASGYAAATLTMEALIGLAVVTLSAFLVGQMPPMHM